MLNVKITISPGEVFFNEEYLQVISVSTFLVADHWNVSGFSSKTIYFLVSNLLGRRIGKVDRSFA